MRIIVPRLLAAAWASSASASDWPMARDPQRTAFAPGRADVASAAVWRYPLGGSLTQAYLPWDVDGGLQETVFVAGGRCWPARPTGSRCGETAMLDAAVDGRGLRRRRQISAGSRTSGRPTCWTRRPGGAVSAARRRPQGNRRDPLGGPTGTGFPISTSRGRCQTFTTGVYGVAYSFAGALWTRGAMSRRAARGDERAAAPREGDHDGERRRTLYRRASFGSTVRPAPSPTHPTCSAPATRGRRSDYAASTRTGARRSSPSATA